jgi:hypothetical protein
MREPRVIYGFCQLFITTILIAVIALGKVEEKTSFGLLPLIGALVYSNGQFSQWFYQNKLKENNGSTSI